jgi:amidase
MTALYKYSASEISNGIKQKLFSARDVTESALSRLDAVNPAINAVVDTHHDDALAEADRIDQCIAQNENPGDLAGVPVTIKINIDQAERMNTNGLLTQKDHRAKVDNPVVSNLKKSGAIVIGSTNTPAFSMRWFTNNRAHGHTLNPHNSNLTPGGSSGGAASAVAAGIGNIGHGTDIAGSVRYPAYACGVHGLRPTSGRVPAVNLSLPDRHIGAQLTAVSGPIARSIDDLEAGYRSMMTGDPRDPWWIPAPHALGSYPKQVAVCKQPEGWELSPEIHQTLDITSRQLEDAGWEVVETECPPLREASDLQLLLWMSEYRRNRGKAIEKEDDPISSFVYTQLIENSPEPTMDSLMDALQRRAALAREWQVFLTRYPLMLCAVSSERPFEDQRDTRSASDFRDILEAQLIQIALPFIGMPGMTVTTEIKDAIPGGVQLLSARFREDILFDAARDIASRNPAIGIVTPSIR